MKAEIRDAIEAARTVEINTLATGTYNSARRHSFDKVRALVYAVAQELPSDMTMQELCDELSIAQNQEPQS